MYHDLLPMGNANRYDKKIRGTILKSQLFGRARDLVPSIAAEDLRSYMGVQQVVNAIYTRDTLTVLNDVYFDFNNLVSEKRGQTEVSEIMRRDLSHSYRSSMLMDLLCSCLSQLRHLCLSQVGI